MPIREEPSRMMPPVLIFAAHINPAAPAPIINVPVTGIDEAMDGVVSHVISYLVLSILSVLFKLIACFNFISWVYNENHIIIA